MRIVFRDSKGRIISALAHLGAIKTVKVGKKTYKKRDIVKKYVKRIRRERLKPRPKPKLKPKIELKPEVSFEIKHEIYETQLNRLGGQGHTEKFETEVNWFDIREPEDFIKAFEDFWKEVERPKKAYMVKFGMILEDAKTREGVSNFTRWLLMVFRKWDFDEILSDLWVDIRGELDKILELANRYNVVNLDKAVLTIMFLVEGSLKK